MNFLAGRGPEFVPGCTSIDPAKSYWRFHVEFSPAGAGKEEIAYEKGMAHYFGAPGTIILFDEIDEEMKRLPLRPINAGLETERLECEDVQSFLNASAIRVETPRIVFEIGNLDVEGRHRQNVEASLRRAERRDDCGFMVIILAIDAAGRRRVSGARFPFSSLWSRVDD